MLWFSTFVHQEDGFTFCDAYSQFYFSVNVVHVHVNLMNIHKPGAFGGYGLSIDQSSLLP